jgi:hypothetical protein
VSTRSANGEKSFTPSLTPPAEIDPDLTVIINGWPMLPAAIRAAMVAMVESTSRRSPEKIVGGADQ